MYDEGNFFKDAPLIDYCETCRKELYQGEEAFFDTDTGYWFCCEECAVSFMEVVEFPAKEVEQPFIMCPDCGKPLFMVCDEVVKCEGAYFCDNGCVLNYFGIAAKTVDYM